MKRARPKPYRFKLEEFLDEVYWAVAQFNANTQASLSDHELVIRLRRRHAAQPAAWLCRQEAFSSLLFDTLRSWGVGQRGSRMVGRKEFYARLHTLVTSAAFTKIANRQVHDVRDSKAWRVRLRALWDEATGPARIMESNSVFVGTTKLLHHLLPDLVPPMDREYTLGFLSALDPADPASSPFKTTAADMKGDEFGVFYKGMQFTAHVARKRPGLADFIDRGPMSGSVPKLVDNAVMAWWGS